MLEINARPQHVFEAITQLWINLFLTDDCITHVAFSPLIILTRMKRLKASPRLKTAGEGSEGPNSGTDFSENTDMWYESVSWKGNVGFDRHSMK